MLMDCWTQLSQDTFNRAINHLLKRLKMVIKARGAHTKFHVDYLYNANYRYCYFQYLFDYKLGNIHALLSNSA